MAGWGEFPWGGAWDGYSTLPVYPSILYDNVFLLGTIEATDTATGYDIDNITDLRPYTFHQFASAGTKYIRVDSGSIATVVNGVGFLGHNFFTSAATVSVESSTDQINWTVRLAGFTVTTNKAVFKPFEYYATARYWRVKIVTASIAARMAVCLLGERLDFPRYLTGIFDPCPEKINAVSGRSKSGYLIGVTRKNISIEIDASWKGITPTWIENTFRPAWDEHLSFCKPFFWSWDPPSHGTEVYFVSIPPDFQLKMPYDPFRRSLSLTFEGIKE